MNYVADFMLKNLMLIIEVGGITHSQEDITEKDVIRRKALEDAGFKVLRFEDDEVLSSINRVYQQIEAWISEELAKWSTPLIPRQRGTTFPKASQQYLPGPKPGRLGLGLVPGILNRTPMG